MIVCICEICDSRFEKRRARGSLTTCKNCLARARIREWKRQNPERKRELNRRWAAANPAKDRASKRAWEQRNLDKLAAKAQRWRNANPEKTRATWQRSNEKRRAAYAPVLAAKRAQRLATRSRQAVIVERARCKKLGLPLPDLPPLVRKTYRGTCKGCGAGIVRNKADASLERCRKCMKLDHRHIERIRRRNSVKRAMPPWADRQAIAMFYRVARRVSRCTGIPFQVDHIIPLRGKTVSGLHVHNNLRVIPKAQNLRKSTRLEAA